MDCLVYQKSGQSTRANHRVEERALSTAEDLRKAAEKKPEKQGKQNKEYKANRQGV